MHKQRGIWTSMILWVATWVISFFVQIFLHIARILY